MDKVKTHENATNILPIPPALEFPFPNPPTADNAPPLQSTVSSNGHALGATTAETIAKTPVTPSLEKSTTETKPRPPPRKLLSERPVAPSRRSILPLRRGVTTFNPTALHDATTCPDTESDSSSSDDEAPSIPSRTSHLTALSPIGSQTAGPSKGSKRRTESEDKFGRFHVGNEKYKTKGKVSKRDGRLNISVNDTSNRGYLAHALGATVEHSLKKHFEHKHAAEATPSNQETPETKPKRPDYHATLSALSQRPASVVDTIPCPKLNIVIMVIGSRGDIQPFLKVGKILKEEYGHRVRIATHPAFRKFIEEDTDLDFFSVGGDPAELMAFMVKNPGLMPSISTVKAGEVGRRRDSMFEMFQGFWRACINSSDEEDDPANLKMMGAREPFVADAIIANPPCFAHVHCAERLGVPLHLMFTFPYSPTKKFPHPLANIKKSNVDPDYTNFMSYPLVEMMTWQGLGDLVNRFRVKTLGLEPVSTLWAPGQLYRLKVPYTYMWSPGLIPKPEDWGPEIDISGFVFLDLASSFKPPDTLAEFLDAGQPPVYIGFGSIVVDDPEKFTNLIFEAIKKAGVRALVSKGWGGLGGDEDTPENVYMLENTPHDWLFPRVSAVVHHGGAGTTAIGLKCGKPTMIVPFFGDQPFWGAMVAKAGAGAAGPIPYKHLDSDALAKGIQQCLTPDAKEAAESIAKSIAVEGDGARNAVESFHRHLPIRGEYSMRCSILPDQVAVWKLKHSNLRLSALAAEILVSEKKIKWSELHLLRHHEWNDFEGPGEPFTGGGAAIVNSFGGFVKGIGSVPVKWTKSIKRNEKRRKASPIPSTEEAGDTKKRRSQSEPQASGKSNHSGEKMEHGLEEKLPTPHGLPGHAHDVLQESKERGEANGTVIHPAPTDRSNQNDDLKASEQEQSASPRQKQHEEHHDNLALDLARDAGAGFAETGEALARVPMDLSLAIAQGFHNAPRLYGDDTVRTAPRINGIRSGLRAAGSELVLGVYDGVSGIFLQPYHGAKSHGTLGFVQGIGKGFGGFILKDISAIISPLGYTMKGLHKEMIKGRQPTAFIRRARMLQGTIDTTGLDEPRFELEKGKVESAWRIVAEIRKEDEMAKQGGVKQRVRVRREQRQVEQEGGFDSVGEARKVLKGKLERRERESVAASAGTTDGSGSGEEGMKGRRRSLTNPFGRGGGKGGSVMGRGRKQGSLSIPEGGLGAEKKAAEGLSAESVQNGGTNGVTPTANGHVRIAAAA